MKWTIEKLQEEANKYETREEFSKNSSSAYIISQKRKLLNKLFENHKNKGYNNCRKIDGYWTIEKLQEEANKYKTRGDFYKGNNSAYYISHSKKLIDILFENHFNKGYDNNRVHRGYWTIEKLQEEVNKYKTRGEFRKFNNCAYSAAKRNKMLDNLFKNHLNEGFSDKKFIYFIYVYEIVEYKKAYVGLTNNIIRRDREHLYGFNENINKFCKENNISYPNYKILETDLKSIEAKKREDYWINFYKNNGWNLFNIRKAGSLGGNVIKWTKSKLQKEADKYQTRDEFYKKNFNGYNIAKSKKMINELFKNHINQGYNEKRKPNGYWTREKLQDEVNKFKTRKDFRKNNKGIYSIAERKKLLNELFENHLNKGYTKIKQSVL